MSELWWAGTGIDPDTQGEAAALELDVQIEGVITGLNVTRPHATIIEPDGSEIHRYYLGSGGIVVSDFYDRTGRRIGFGIQAGSEEDAREHLHEMQTLFVRWRVDALASVWTWCRMESRHPAPREMAFA